MDETTLVRAQDSIRITVLGFPDLGRDELRVGAAGTFQLPLIGTINANGRTAEQIGSEIAQKLRTGRYVVNPEVTVDVLEQPGRLFTMGGEVTKPGRYPLLEPITLLEAVATGGGTSETAKLEEVIVFRTVNGQRYIGLYDLEAIQRGNYADPLIYAGDVVQVGDSPALRRIQTVAGIAPLITAPLILLERVLR
ncbi:polysaccharide biosynthesis/export family protein [Qipengyuania flava]|uniref:polysaccharide biosynthesis/export family protein n=1 Tax=Qipengyuania flava TaxID=192812 RepID=UPI0018DFB8C9|nr:polysaccharide biosynthesis/export family protein [Qipengyuania flava]